jgi:putative RecB family exonuclease
MALDVPNTLSPSKVSSFTECGLAFRFSVIDRLPEPPSLPATRGTLVHLALQHLMDLPPAERTIPAALSCLDRAWEEYRHDAEVTGLGLDGDGEAKLLDDGEKLVRRYFQMEDPTAITPIGLELMLEVPLDGRRLRGIIDRLELDDDGGLVVTDYKTGKSPPPHVARKRLAGVHFYSLLCEQLFGTRPSVIRLLYLGDGTTIEAIPTEQSTRGVERRLGAVWNAIEQACERESFSPKPSKLCDWCSFRAFCPAQGGDPALAVVAKADSGPPVAVVAS